MAKRKVQVDKFFFIRERDTAYDNWLLAWWREKFQNSVDAGAKNIQIFIEEKEARGAFDEYRGYDPKTVIRVVFSDDGCGMTRDVLENVYFKVGHTTKVGNDGMVGGFGRARIMTCFSQDRYSILTRDNFVMGNGDDYDILSLDTALEEIAAYDKNAETQAPGVPFHENSTRVGLSADREMIQFAREAKAADGIGFDGCRIEVDMETWKTPGYDGNRPANIVSLKDALKQYLSESQIKPTVTINGRSPEDFFHTNGPLETRKGRAKAVLSVGAGEDKKDFAKVYVVKTADETKTSNLIVRVDGASMYSDPIYTLNGFDVVVEVEPKMSRQVLNSNRDGMHSQYSRELSAFKQKLTVDTTSALRDRSGKKHYTVRGEHGALISERKSLPTLMRYNEEDRNRLEPRLESPPTTKPREVTFLQEANVTFDVAKAFVTAVRHRDSFLNAVRWGEAGSSDSRQKVQMFEDSLYSHPLYEENPQAAIVETCPPELLPWIVEEITNRVEKARDELKAGHERLLADMHDTVIRVETFNDKTRSLPRKYDPNNWSVETGKGKRAHGLLAAWTTAIAVVNEALFEVRPAVEPFQWRVGFIFSVAEMKWEGDDTRPGNTLASHGRSEDDSSIHEFLINPVDDHGKMAFKLTDDADIWRIIAFAVHEVSHVLESWHDERFAKLQTDLLAKISPVSAMRRVKQNTAATLAAYGGKTTVHALDSKPGPRPADRLRKLANGNHDFAPGIDAEHGLSVGVN